MAQYGPELATSGRDAINRVHEFDSRRSQQDASEYIYSSYDGIVDQVLPAEGSAVGGGATICTLRLTGGRKDLKGVLYIPVDKGKRVRLGMTVQLAPNGVDVSQSGSLLGDVKYASYTKTPPAKRRRGG